MKQKNIYIYIYTTILVIFSLIIGFIFIRRSERTAEIKSRQNDLSTGSTSGQVNILYSDNNGNMSTNQLTPNRKVGTDFTGKLNTYSESGMIAYFAMQTPPTGWVECDGANYSNTMYPELYTAIGITYGGTLKNGTFNVPDLRGNFIRCLNYSATGTDPNRTLSGTPQASSAILNYTPGTDTAALFNHPNNTAMNTIKFGEPSTVPFVDPMVLTYSPDTKNTGEASYKSIRPQNIAMLACIKT